jgi:LuxR family maltose regulon positive regulatory protein
MTDSAADTGAISSVPDGMGFGTFVSRNTVSSEVGSIYRKLGVSSHSDAVRQATMVGLLGG